jgi:hypothetical protein
MFDYFVYIVRPQQGFVMEAKSTRPAQADQKSSPLDEITAEYDELLERMQVPDVCEATRAALRASPEELGRAALAAAQRKRDGCDH